MDNKIYVVGIGPGAYEQMTMRAAEALRRCDVIVGYTVYVELVKEHFANKRFLTTPMKKEIERCRLAFEEANKGYTVAMICSGDAGVYGMSGLMLEIGQEYPHVEVEVIPGVTAANGGAAVLGAPLIHDFAVISLSDLLTPWEYRRQNPFFVPSFSNFLYHKQIIIKRKATFNFRILPIALDTAFLEDCMVMCIREAISSYSNS